MNDERTQFTLACRDSDAPAPVLVDVQAEGRLDAVLFGLTLRQTYRNTSDRVLEVVYTFPLPFQAVLLGFASELNGERQEGVVVAKREAERQYEESLKEGDAPVMLESHADGLHTANIGNLKPGDEIVLECRFVQLLSFEQGRLRVAIPTTIAPRYGRAEQAGLQPQQVPLASLDAEYRLKLSIAIGQALVGAKAECPTHRFETTEIGDGSIRLDLAPSARQDRDVVVIVTPRERRPSLLVRATDAANPSAPVVVMAALQPPPGVPRARIGLKLLVDCSGSMNGDSIASARAALHGVIDGLGELDRLCLSRFGSTIEHLIEPTAGKPQALRHIRSVIDAIQADLGGTEMEGALAAVFGLSVRDEEKGGDVLLITDGEIWQADEMVAAARTSGHRVFAIGVGSAPAEGVLRSLAEATGGACEFATPGEALEAAALRMLSRIRQPQLNHARVDWGKSPVWTCGPTLGLFGGDTVIALAGFSETIDGVAVRLLADDAQGKTVELARGEADAPCPGDTLPRVAAARRLSASTESDALAMAVQYQLMSKQTNCILVHQRAAADKTTEQAELRRVSSMVAAGWGGIGTVRETTASYSLESRAMFSRAMPSAASADIHFSLADDAFEIPAFLRKRDDDQATVSLEVLARRVEDHLANGGRIDGLAASMEGVALHDDAKRAIDEAVALGLTLEQAWLVLATWVNARPNGLADAALKALLLPLVDALDVQLVASATKVMERILGGFPVDGWTMSRVQRLRRALGRMGT
jgi:Ca-activated chloride channel family protein